MRYTPFLSMADAAKKQVTKSYTGTGDAGQTSLRGGERVSKTHPRVGVCGVLDELNAWIGYIRSQHTVEKEIDLFLGQVQSDLFAISAEIAKPNSAGSGRNVAFDAKKSLVEMEALIDALNEKLPLLTQFILPGGTKTASLLHVARTVCRRAERLLVALNEHEPIDKSLLAYLNRLSSAFFVIARTMNFKSGVKETTW